MRELEEMAKSTLPITQPNNCVDVSQTWKKSQNNPQTIEFGESNRNHQNKSGKKTQTETSIRRQSYAKL